MIVHLSGAPGSGKTTIAQRVQKPGWIIHDLDDLNRQFIEGNNLLKLTRTNPKQVVSLYQDHIVELVRSARQAGTSILFVGINSGLLGSPPGTHLVKLYADYKVFLNVDIALNAQRWIQRDMPEVLDMFVNSLKDDIKEYRRLERNEVKMLGQYKRWFSDIVRDFRPSQRKGDILKFKRVYSRLGYKLMTGQEFTDWFSSLQ